MCNIGALLPPSQLELKLIRRINCSKHGSNPSWAEGGGQGDKSGRHFCTWLASSEKLQQSGSSSPIEGSMSGEKDANLKGQRGPTGGRRGGRGGQRGGCGHADAQAPGGSQKGQELEQR